MDKVYICKIAILGFPFAVLTEGEAQDWIAQDPEMHYYETVEIKSTKEVENV